MRLVLVGDHPPPPGGIATHVAQLRELMISKHIAVRVLDLGKGPVGLERPSGVDAVKSRWRLAPWLLRHATGADALHVHVSGNNRKAWLVAGLAGACGRGAKRRLLTVHSGLCPAFLSADRRNRQIARLALDRFDTVLCVSAAVQSALHALPFPIERLVVAPAFLASAVRPGPLPEALVTLGRRFEPLVAMAFHPAPVYGFSLMLEAVQQLARSYSRLGLVLFGPGADEGLNAQLQASGLVERTLLVGPLAPAQALAVVARANLFVRPTHADGDSISVREALALGTPCVASDASVRPEGVTLFRTGDAGSLANAVERALARGPVEVPAVDVWPLLLRLYRGGPNGLGSLDDGVPEGRGDATTASTSWA